MGGWIAFYVSLEIKKKVSGIIGISAAFDFTSKLVNSLSKKEYRDYISQNRIKVKSEYSETPYIFKKSFIDNSINFSLLDRNVKFKQKIALLYGLKDSSVDLESQMEMLEKFTNPCVSLILSKNSDHRMSSSYDLNLLKNSLIYFIKSS